MAGTCAHEVAEEATETTLSTTTAAIRFRKYPARVSMMPVVSSIANR